MQGREEDGTKERSGRKEGGEEGKEQRARSRKERDLRGRIVAKHNKVERNKKQTEERSRRKMFTSSLLWKCS